MKFNVDCIRDVMLAVEDIPYHSEIWFSELCERMPKYTKDDIEYACLLLAESGYLEAEVEDQILSEFKTIGLIRDLTMSGHAFLECIRPQTAWEKAKTVLVKTGKATLSTLAQIAADLATQYTSSNFPF